MNGTMSRFRKFKVVTTSGRKVQWSTLRQTNTKSWQDRTQGAFSNSVWHEWIDWLGWSVWFYYWNILILLKVTVPQMTLNPTDWWSFSKITVYRIRPSCCCCLIWTDWLIRLINMGLLFKYIDPCHSNSRNKDQSKGLIILFWNNGIPI